MAGGFKIAEGFIEVETTYNEGDLTKKAISAFGRLGRIGKSQGRDTVGKGLVGGITESLTSGLKNAVLSGMQGLGSVASALGTNPYVAAIGAALAAGIVAVALPAIGAGLSGALIGGAGLGVIGLGAFLLKEEPEVKAAAGSLMDTVKKIFTAAAQPLVKPFVQALGIFEKLAKQLSPQISKIFAAIAPAIVPLADALADLVASALPGFVDLVKASVPFLKEMGPSLRLIGGALGSFFSSIAEGGPGATIFFKDLFVALGTLIIVAGNTIGWLAKAYGAVHRFFAAIPGWASSAVGWFKGLGASIGGWVSSVVSWFSALPGRVGGAIAALPGRVRAIFLSLFDMVTRAIGVGLGTAVGFFLALPGRVAGAIKAMPGRVASAFSSAVSVARSLASSLVSGAVSIISNLPGRVASALSRVRGAVTGAFSGAGGWLVGAGADMVRGLIRGIQSMVGAAISAAVRAGNNIVAGFKDALGISSPSKVMAEQVGKPIMQGIQKGMDRERPRLADAFKTAVPDLVLTARSSAKAAPAPAPASSVANYYTVNMVVDPTKIKRIDDVVEMIHGLKTTSRMFTVSGVPQRA